MFKISMSLSLVACMLTTAAFAESQGALLQSSEMSIGGGVSRNSVDARGYDDSEIGFQIFMAYDLKRLNLIDGAQSSVELGYMDYGFSRGDDGGLWTTFVLDGAIRQDMRWLVRLGLDLGDDSGFMFGAGVGFRMSPAAQIRVEYVVRDDVDSLQLNIIYHL